MTMKLQKLFDQVESLSFEINMSVLSGFNSFYSALGANELVGQLIREAGKTHKAEAVYARFIDLLHTNDQTEYANPHDAALAAYLYTLQSVEPGLAHQAAEEALKTPQLALAKRVAEKLISDSLAFSTEI